MPPPPEYRISHQRLLLCVFFRLRFFETAGLAPILVGEAPNMPGVALEATEQIQNQDDYQNGSEDAVGPVAVSITAGREGSY